MPDTPKTFYLGVGADEAIAELHSLVGEITANWADVEDGFFHLFVAAIAGRWDIGDIRPYRAVFFTFSSYEGKMRMVRNAMKARYGENKEIMSEWEALKKDMDGFAKVRNEIAHLIPNAKHSSDSLAKANVRLVPPFWKGTLQEQDFNELGYSLDQLLQAVAPYWGYHSRINRFDVPGETLAYRLQQFANKLLIPLPPPLRIVSPNS